MFTTRFPPTTFETSFVLRTKQRSNYTFATQFWITNELHILKYC